MDPKFKTSFIPKGATTAGRKPIRKHSSIGLFLIIGMIVFVISLAAAAAAFLYQRSLSGELQDLDARLAEARENFGPETIETIIRLNKRIESAKEVLAAHNTVSPLFALLSDKTLRNVQYEDFSYKRNGGSFSVNMSGKALDLEAVALQSDIFGSEKEFTNPVFDSFDLSEGRVSFKFTAGVKADFLSFNPLGTTTSSAKPFE